jgi:hypothetical protein
MARFMRKGRTKIFWVLTIANLSAPTAAEVNGGTRIDTELAEINGFSFANTPIDTPDMATTFVSKIPGEDTVGESNMTFYEQTTTNPISTALAKGTVGNVVIFYNGTAGATPAAADKAEVWPCIVASNAKLYTTSNEAAKYMVVFTNTAGPSAATLV